MSLRTNTVSRYTVLSPLLHLINKVPWLDALLYDAVEAKSLMYSFASG